MIWNFIVHFESSRSKNPMFCLTFRNCSVSLELWRRRLSTTMLLVGHLAQRKSFFNGEMTHSAPWNSIMGSHLMVKYFNFLFNWVQSASLAGKTSSSCIVGHWTGLVTVKVQSKAHIQSCPTADAPWRAVFTLRQVSKTWPWVHTGVILSPIVTEPFPSFSGNCDHDVFLAGLFAE